jgi:hypothetical protein
VSVLAVGGAVNATLVQDRNRVVLRPERDLVEYLVALDQGRDAGGEPVGIRSDWLPQQEIAISRPVADSGVFSLDFGGEQYLPFEGTGAVSDWTLAIPPESNSVDLGRLADVVFEVRYTARDGGSTFMGEPSFRTDVLEVLRQNGVRRGGRLHLDTRSAFPDAWAAFVAKPAAEATTQALRFEVGAELLANPPSPRLDQVAVKLDSPGGTSIGDGTAFVSLEIGGHSFDLAFQDGLAVVSPGLTGFLGPWSLTVKLADAPAAVLDADGKALDPAALRNVELLLTFSTPV